MLQSIVPQFPFLLVIQPALLDLIFRAVTNSVIEVSGEFVAPDCSKNALSLKTEGAMETRSHHAYTTA